LAQAVWAQEGEGIRQEARAPRHAMPKKKPVKLPQVSGATPRREFQAKIASGRAGQSSCGGEDLLWEGGAFHLQRSILSPAEAHQLSEFLDASISLPLSFGGCSGSRSSSGGSGKVDGEHECAVSGKEWQVQSKEDILQDVKKAVLERRPWHREEDLDDAFLERRRRSERELRGDSGIHIILPDNRVRAMEDQLGSRIRAELLGEEEGFEHAVSAPSCLRRADESRAKAKAARRPRNPWYLPASYWYNPEALKDPSAERGGGFPYDSQILPKDQVESRDAEEQEREDSPGGEGRVRALTRREKETLQIVEAYKAYIKGHRLPHFLQ